MSNHSVKVVNGRNVHSFKFTLSDLKEKLNEAKIYNYELRVISEAMRCSCITEAVKHVKFNNRGNR